MNRRRVQLLIFVGSIVLAFLLQLTPLPQTFLPLKPYWIALVLIYWSIEAPDRVGLGFAFLIGLCGDLLTGQLLGEQALRLIVLIFIVLPVLYTIVEGALERRRERRAAPAGVPASASLVE